MDRSRFAVTRQRRGLLVAGVAVLVCAAVTMGILVVRLHVGAEAYLAWIGLGGAGGFFVLMIASMVPQPATIEIIGDTLQASWQRRPIRIDRSRIRFGRWVLPSVDTDLGVVMEIGGLRIGATDHDGAGYRVEATATRSVSAQLPASDFDALAARLGVAREAPDPDALRVWLIRNSQSAGGVLGMMGPWILTIVVVGGFGLFVGVTEIGQRLQRAPGGRWIITGLTVLGVVGGLAATVFRGMRVRKPALELRGTATELVLARFEGDELARAPWSAVAASAHHHRVQMKGSSMTIPVLQLGLGGHAPVMVSTWADHEPWAARPRMRRSPRYLIGRPQWPLLVAALRRHGVIEA